MKFSGKWLVVLALAALVLFFVFRPSKSTTGATASLNVGKTESHSNLSSSTTSSSSDNSALATRRVLFLTNHNPHPLSQRIDALVIQGLTNSSLIENVEIGSATSSRATETPDLFLRIDTSAINEEGVLRRTLKTTVAASLGSAPWQSRHFIQSRSTPPLVQFNWNGKLEHESKFSGVRTDRYKDVARDIADQLLKGITNQLDDLSKKYPMLPELPPEFYGPYEPIEDFAFLKEMNAQRVCSYHGLFTHNETFWQFQTVTDPLPTLQRIAGQLRTDGWRVDNSILTNSADYYQRFVRKGAELEIFHEQSDRPDLTNPGQPRSALEFVVRYQKIFSDSEREAALEKLFTANSSLETLLPFQNSLFPKQTEHYYALLEKAPAASPRSYVLLAENYWQRRDTNAALKMLLRAKAFGVSGDSSGVDSRIEELARKISPKEKLKLEVAPELYREFGFLEITNAPQTFELERAFGQPVLLFLDGKRGLETFSLTIGHPQKGSYPWTMIEAQGNGRSSSSSGFSLPTNGAWQQSFTFGERTLIFSATLLSDGKGFKHRVETK